MKKYIALLMAVIMTLVLVGCGPTEATESENSDSTDSTESTETSTSESTTDSVSEASNFNDTSVLYLPTSVGGDPIDTQLKMAWGSEFQLYPHMIFDCLVRMASDGKTIVPALAKDLEISDDGLTYTFTIQDDVKWHDGESFTAEDVAFSIEYAIKVPKIGSADWINVVGVEEYAAGEAESISGLSVSGDTVAIELISQDNQFIIATIASFFIMPKHLIESIDPLDFETDTSFWANPVGTGVYKVDETSFPDYFKLIRNEDYFKAKAAIKHVVISSYATGGNEALAAALIAGDIDLAYGDAMNDINSAKNIVSNNPDVEMKIIPATYSRQFLFNLGPSQDGKWNGTDIMKKEVRQAISLIIDKVACANMYEGQAVASSTLVNPEDTAYNTNIALPADSHSIEIAHQMLVDAGFDFSKTWRLLYYYDDATTADILAIMKQNFADAGITLETFYDATDEGFYDTRNYDITYCGAYAPDPILKYKNLITPGGTYDKIMGGDDTLAVRQVYVDLIEQYVATTDPAEMKSIGDQIQQQAYDDSFIIPLYCMNKIAVYNAAKVNIPDEVFNMDLVEVIDWQFDKWELLK